MLDIPKIKAVLKEASQWDMDYPIFGSHSHAHLFRPPLPMEELDAWEELMELRRSTAWSTRKRMSSPASRPTGRPWTSISPVSRDK